jgi:transcriptional regulator with XRE-family HTH domain
MNALELSIALREFRGATGYTDAEAATALGLGYTAFCDLKNQRNLPKPDRIAEIARRLCGQSARKHNAGIAAAEFAEKLSAWRNSGALSQRGAARALRVTAATVHAWEHLLKAPGPRALLRLAPILSAPPPSGQKHSRIDPAFSPRLRAWRKASLLTQSEACALLRISDKATLSHYERSRAMPCPERLALIEQKIAAGPALTPRTHAEISLPQRLRAWRNARGLMQTEACAILGVPDVCTLSDYECGHSLPLPDRLAHIEATISGEAALPAALADIECLEAKLTATQTLRRRLEARMQRTERAIERLQARLDRRKREAASLHHSPEGRP